MAQRRAGILFVKIDGIQYDAKGSFNYNLGANKREGIVGADKVHGYKEMPQIPFIEGEFTDSQTLDLSKLLNVTSATITLELANGKIFVLREAWYAGDGNVGSEDGNIAVRFEGVQGEEVA